MDGIRRTGTVQGDRDSSLLIDAPLRRIDVRIICDDWARAQALTHQPVKINLPGPVTFASRVPSSHYHSHEQLARDYARLLGAQLAALESAGCKWVQIDDPHIIWDFQECPYGVECLDEALAFTSGKLQAVVHMCQGNPYSFIEDSSPARGNVYYESVAPQLAKSRVDAIAIEKPNVPGLREFNLGLFGEKTIFLGLVDVADASVESPSDIADDIIKALKEVPANRLVITPDCGIKHFPEQLALQKLQSMRLAVDAVNTEITKISLPQ
jgi:5-methyltetrahydropteroyltriglutamate--homocysteine methyltransferase